MATMTMLFGYFAVFGNYNLVQMLQYSDLLQFALTALPPSYSALVSAFWTAWSRITQKDSAVFSSHLSTSAGSTGDALPHYVFHFTLRDRSSTALKFFLIAPPSHPSPPVLWFILDRRL